MVNKTKLFATLMVAILIVAGIAIGVVVGTGYFDSDGDNEQSGTASLASNTAGIHIISKIEVLVDTSAAPQGRSGLKVSELLDRFMKTQAYDDSGTSYSQTELETSLTSPVDTSLYMVDLFLCLTDKVNMDESQLLNRQYVTTLKFEACMPDNLEDQFTIVSNNRVTQVDSNGTVYQQLLQAWITTTNEWDVGRVYYYEVDVTADNTNSVYGKAIIKLADPEVNLIMKLDGNTASLIMVSGSSTTVFNVKQSTDGADFYLNAADDRGVSEIFGKQVGQRLFYNSTATYDQGSLISCEDMNQETMSDFSYLVFDMNGTLVQRSSSLSFEFENGEWGYAYYHEGNIALYLPPSITDPVGETVSSHDMVLTIEASSVSSSYRTYYRLVQSNGEEFNLDPPLTITHTVNAGSTRGNCQQNPEDPRNDGQTISGSVSTWSIFYGECINDGTIVIGSDNNQYVLKADWASISYGAMNDAQCSDIDLSDLDSKKIISPSFSPPGHMDQPMPKVSKSCGMTVTEGITSPISPSCLTL